MQRRDTPDRGSMRLRSNPLVLILSLILVVLAGCSGSPAAPQAQTLTIGIVNASPAREVVVEAFKAELSRLGYAEGERVQYLYEGALSDAAARDAWATSLAEQEVDLILAVTTPGAQSAAAATTTIPVVFVPVTDPVGAGLVASLREPGGNVTGITNGNPHPVRLQLLRDINPAIRRVYVPVNSQSAPSQSSMTDVRAVAAQLELELIEEDLQSDAAIMEAIASLPADIDAIFISPDPRIASYSAEWVTAAQAVGIPVSSLSATEVESGVLMSYGENLTAAAAQSARMADTILRGASPASIPVETTEYFLSLNLATAQTINLTVPDDVIRRAQTVIRP